MSKLKELFEKYNCDKGYRHGYHECYEKHMDPTKPVRLLEIGTFKGESTRAFLDYFDDVQITCADMFDREESIRVDDPRVEYFIADSQAPETHKKFKEFVDGKLYDYIIDDAEHTHLANLKTWNNFYPFLKEDGIYFVEDVKGNGRVSNPPSWLQNHLKKHPIHQWHDLLRKIKHDGYAIETFDNREIMKSADSYIVIAKHESNN